MAKKSKKQTSQQLPVVTPVIPSLKEQIDGKQIMIFGLPIRINFSNQVDENTCGMYYSDEKLIVINENRSPAVQLVTLYHEMVHALFRRLSLIQVIPPEIEELIADSVAKMFYESFDFKSIRTALQTLEGVFSDKLTGGAA